MFFKKFFYRLSAVSAKLKMLQITAVAGGNFLLSVFDFLLANVALFHGHGGLCLFT